MRPAGFSEAWLSREAFLWYLKLTSAWTSFSPSWLANLLEILELKVHTKLQHVPKRIKIHEKSMCRLQLPYNPSKDLGANENNPLGTYANGTQPLRLINKETTNENNVYHELVAGKCNDLWGYLFSGEINLRQMKPEMAMYFILNAE